MVSALDRELWVTQFPDVLATSRHSEFMSLRALGRIALDTEAATKDDLPLIKLCSFGDKKTAKNSLRHDRNVNEAYGLELDYDAERLSPEDIADALRRHNIAGLVVTSPSHRDEAPRARILLPFSTPLRPEVRERMASRVAGIIPDDLAPESWTLSQAYYIGRIADAPSHRVLEVEGDYIDLRPDLDASAKPKPAPAKKASAKRNGVNGAHAHTATTIDPSMLPVDADAALDAVAAGDGSHDSLVRLAGRWVAHGMPQADIVATLANALYRRPEADRDAGWQQAMDDLPRLVRWVYEQEEEAAASAAGQPPPPPPPGAGGSTAGPNAQPPQQPAKPLLKRRSGKFACNVENVMTLLRQHSDLVGCFGYDLMARSAMVMRLPPWGHGPFVGAHPATDGDYTALQGWLQREAALAQLGRDTTHQAADRVAEENSFHPVRDYLHALTWDGTKRLDTWLTTYAGVPASEYANAVGRMFLIGMIARVERPGCKMDYVLVLEGPQGILKSQLLKELATPWFSDQLPDIHHGGKEASQHLRGLWLIEIAELDAMARADVLAFNAFVTRSVEIYRPAYGRKDVREPRQCVLTGTTNQQAYLRDPTGARRFWGVTAGAAGKIDPPGLRQARDQLFAEALVALRAGEHWWPSAAFEAKHIKPEQSARAVVDAWHEPIQDWLARAKTKPVTVLSIAQGALTLDTAMRLTPRDQQRITAILQRLGWRACHSKTARWWEPPP